MAWDDLINTEEDTTSNTLETSPTNTAWDVLTSEPTPEPAPPPRKEESPSIREGAVHNLLTGTYNLLNGLITNPYDTLDKIGAHIDTSLEEIRQEPIRAVPAIAGIAGGTLGSLSMLGPVGPMVGSTVGRAAGEWLESRVRGTPFITNQNLFEILSEGLWNAPIGMVAATLKRKAIGMATVAAGASWRPAIKVAKTLPEAVLQAKAASYTKRVAQFLTNPEETIARTLWGGKELPELTGVREELLGGEDVVGSALEQLTKQRAAIGARKLPPGNKDIVGNALEELATMQAKPTKQLPELRPVIEKYLGGEDTIGKFLDEQVAGRKTFNWETGKYEVGRTPIDIRRAAQATRDRSLREMEVMAGTPDVAPTPLWRNHELLVNTGVPTTPLQSELHKVGVLADFQNPQYILNKTNEPNLQRIAAIINDGQEMVHGTTSYYYDKLDIIFNDLDFPISVKDPGYYKVAGKLHYIQENKHLLKQLNEGTLAQSVLDDPYLMKALHFQDRLNKDITNPMFKMALDVHSDPTKLAMFREAYEPTIAGLSEKRALERNIAHTQDLLADMDPTNPFAKQLAESLDIDSRRLALVEPLAQEARIGLEKATAYFEKYGKFADDYGTGSFERKFTDLTFGSDLPLAIRSQIYDVAHALQLSVDMPAHKMLLKNVEYDPSYHRYASNYIMAQTGSIQAAKMGRVATVLSNIPIFGKYFTPENTAKTFRAINNYIFTVHIALNPRFMPTNLSQSLLTRAVVRDEAFSHGITQAMFNWKEAFTRAETAGVIRKEDMLTYFMEGADMGQGRSMLRATREGLAKPAKFTEILNRVIANESGLYRAAQEGITDTTKQITRAKEIVELTQFNYNQASRAPITNNPIGMLAYRFKSYTANMANTLATLARQDKGAFAEYLMTMLALGGTAGVPTYSFVRDHLAGHGILLPQIQPLDQITGLNLGTGMDMFFSIRNPYDLAGPVLGPVGKVGLGLTTGDDALAAQGIQSLIGPLASKGLLGALPEAIRRGATYNPSGRQTGKRTGMQELLSGLNLGETLKQSRAKAVDEIGLALKAENYGAMNKAIKRYEDMGGLDLGKILGQARGKNTQEENTSVLSQLIGSNAP